MTIVANLWKVDVFFLTSVDKFVIPPSHKKAAHRRLKAFLRHPVLGKLPLPLPLSNLKWRERRHWESHVLAYVARVGY